MKRSVIEKIRNRRALGFHGLRIWPFFVTRVSGISFKVPIFSGFGSHTVHVFGLRSKNGLSNT